MKRRIWALIAVVVFVSAGSSIRALPNQEVDSYYYDAAMNMIAEHDILCNGAHYDWGDNTGWVYLWQERYDCASGGSFSQCSYRDIDGSIYPIPCP